MSMLIIPFVPAAMRYPVLLGGAPALLAMAGLPPMDSATGRSLAANPGERLLGKRVLIVEDEALVAFDLQLAFEDEGAEVIGPAQSLTRALDVVAREPEIDLALLDVDLAGENVYPVAEALRQRGVPFAFHTGHASRSELSAMFPGAKTFVKPSAPDTLIAHLAGLGR